MIRLTSREITSVLALVNLPMHLRAILAASPEGGATISDEIAAELLDSVTSSLVQHGFDERYRPTAEGLELEELVDRLTRDG